MHAPKAPDLRTNALPFGPHLAPYIIAELGVNHDGSVERALALTDAAADAGASAIKLQLFDADLLMSRASTLAAYQARAGEHDPLAMLRRLQLSLDDMAPVVQRAHARNLHAIVTVFSEQLVALSARLSWDAYKTASPDIVHRPLLEALSATGKPLILSTGAATLCEVARAIDWLAHARDRVALLQCVSSYPTPMDQAQIGGIASLARLFAGPIGYSDHTEGVETGARAVRAGACILEKHVTYSRAAQGPDHAASLEPPALSEYVARAREAWAQARAQGVQWPAPEKAVQPIERDVRRVSRQSLVATRALRAGESLTRADLACKRPGTGLAPWLLAEVLGRRAARDIAPDTPLVPADLDGPPLPAPEVAHG